jgi:hypothetical protein
MFLRCAVRVVVIGAGTLFMYFAGILVALAGNNIAPGDVDARVLSMVVMRSFLVLTLLFVLAWFFRVRDRKAGGPSERPEKQLLIAAGIAYLVNFASWGGHSLFGQLLVPAGVFSMLFDFVVWMLVVFGGVRLAERARVQAATAPIPYA